MSTDRNKYCHELKVAKKIQETPDTVSLVLAIPEPLKNKFKYKAGQFITLFLNIKGEDIRRSYSLASCPETDNDFKISAKLVSGGKGSTYLVNDCQVGDTLWATPPAGLFCLPNILTTNKIAFYAAGSGITPIISMIKSALAREKDVACHLLYQSKNENLIIFKSELAELANQFAPRLNVEYSLSAPPLNWQGLKGRCDKNSVKEFLTKNAIDLNSLHFMCGPNGFMDTIESALYDLNVAKTKIFRESFTPASPITIAEDAILIGDREQLGIPETIEATIEGETHMIPVQKDKSILDTLLDAGLNPPYSCLDGACMACMAKVEAGVVYQKDMAILTDDNIAARECLTCQARPASKKVKINYEIF